MTRSAFAQAMLAALILQLAPRHANADADVIAQSVRKEFLLAYQQARAGRPPTAASANLKRYVLWPYIEAALLEKLGAKASDELAATFFARSDLPTSQRVRRTFLLSLAQSGDWQRFVAWRDPSDSDLRIRCHTWSAGQFTLNATQDALVLWQAADRAIPACAAPFKHLESAGALSPQRVQARLDSAFAARAYDLIPWLTQKLPAAQRVWPTRRLALAQHSTQTLKQSAAWQDEPQKGRWLSEALVAMARRDPRSAETLRVQTAHHTTYEPTQQHQMWAAIATRAAVDDLPETSVWLQRIPDGVTDTALGEWAVRHYLSDGELKNALAAYRWMSAESLASPRWRYVRARLQQELGAVDSAMAGFTELAKEANFHAFLAADRAELPYRICPRPSQATEAARILFQASNGWKRAQELRRLGFPEAALAELKFLSSADPERRHALVELLLANEWTRLAIEIMSGAVDLQVYTLRFPSPYRKLITRYTQKRQLDPYWVRGLIRAESAFDPHARSHADARGLMQMLPSTARLLGNRKTAPNLYQPAISVALGTTYMRMRYDGFGSDMLAATAAYNAGQNAVKRWLPKASRRWPDLWVETIPFLETREYVARVLAFSVLYDALDGAPVRRLSSRISGPIGALTSGNDQLTAPVLCASP